MPIDKVHHSVEDCRAKASKDKESQAKAANGEAKVASELGVVFDYELIDNESGYAYTLLVESSDDITQDSEVFVPVRIILDSVSLTRSYIHE